MDPQQRGGRRNRGRNLRKECLAGFRYGRRQKILVAAIFEPDRSGAFLPFDRKGEGTCRNADGCLCGMQQPVENHFKRPDCLQWGMAGNFSCHRISKTEPSALSGIAHDSSRQSPVCGFDSCKGKAPAGKSCEKSGFFPDRERRHPYALAFEQRSGGETGGGCLRREIWSSDDRRRTGEDGSFHAGRYPSQSRD